MEAEVRTVGRRRAGRGRLWKLEMATRGGCEGGATAQKQTPLLRAAGARPPLQTGSGCGAQCQKMMLMGLLVPVRRSRECERSVVGLVMGTEQQDRWGAGGGTRPRARKEPRGLHSPARIPRCVGVKGSRWLIRPRYGDTRPRDRVDTKAPTCRGDGGGAEPTLHPAPCTCTGAVVPTICGLRSDTVSLTLSARGRTGHGKN